MSPKDDPSRSIGEATRLLGLARAGDEEAGSQLFALVYEELKAIAVHFFQSQPSGHTLQPTALVHEAWFRLGNASEGGYEGRSHFLAVAATAMRRILVDHARKRNAEKRGGARSRVTFDDGLTSDPGSEEVDLLSLHSALESLADISARGARIVELRYFGGLSIEETAQILDVSTRTVERDWAIARGWLKKELKAQDSDAAPGARR